MARVGTQVIGTGPAAGGGTRIPAPPSGDTDVRIWATNQRPRPPERPYLSGSLVIGAIAVAWYAVVTLLRANYASTGIWFPLPTIGDRRAAILLGVLALTLFVSADRYDREVAPGPFDERDARAMKGGPIGEFFVAGPAYHRGR